MSIEKKIYVYDRAKGEIREERVIAKDLLCRMYDRNDYRAWALRTVICRLPIVSHLYGAYYKLPWTRKAIPNFIRQNQIDPTEFVKTSFSSFNDFFVRQLRPSCRPVHKNGVIAPADGRYLCYEDFGTTRDVIVKGKKISLFELLGKDQTLTDKYQHASMMVARLAPADYHRFHAPVAGRITFRRNIRGSLFSVNPIALASNVKYITENKRQLCSITTDHHGDILIIAVGATNVGSIKWTPSIGARIEKGDELGYFALGGSMLIILFEPTRIKFDEDLLLHTKEHREVLCKMGQSAAQYKN